MVPLVQDTYSGDYWNTHPTGYAQTILACRPKGMLRHALSYFILMLIHVRQNPSQALNPEQITSLAGLVLYAFLDPLIYRAYMASNLGHEWLPPIADYDESKNLVKRSFPILDPLTGSNKGHIFWGLLKVFREY